MKLWFCSATSIDCEPSDLVVAETEEKAKQYFEESVEQDGIWVGTVYAREVTEVGGYKVALIKDIGKIPKKPRID